MAQILDPIPNDQGQPFLCCYVNATSQIQVARITNLPNWYFERVVFPGQRLVFETLPGAMLEIHTGMMASAILSDTIPCDRLRLREVGDEEKEGAMLSETLISETEQVMTVSETKSREKKIDSERTLVSVS